MGILVACGKVSPLGGSIVELRWKAESFMAAQLLFNTQHKSTEYLAYLLQIRQTAIFNTCGCAWLFSL